MTERRRPAIVRAVALPRADVFRGLPIERRPDLTADLLRFAASLLVLAMGAVLMLAR